MRKIVVVLVALLVLMPASVASAHDPIILTSEQTTPASGPLLVDGTISFALYGSLESSTDTRGFRVHPCNSAHDGFGDCQTPARWFSTNDHDRYLPSRIPNHNANAINAVFRTTSASMIAISIVKV